MQEGALWPEMLSGMAKFNLEKCGENRCYQQFVEQAKEGIDYIDDIVRRSGKVPEKDPPLWQWMTEINPFRFYRFDRIAKEYSKELERSIKADPKIKKPDKVKVVEDIPQQKQLIYT
jgi:hypothetical protein